MDIPSIGRTLKRFKPDIVQIGSPVSILGMRIISMPTKFKVFTECHQHISVAAQLDGLRRDASMWPALLWFRLTRTLPGYLESMRVRYWFCHIAGLQTSSRDSLWVSAEQSRLYSAWKLIRKCSIHQKHT